LYNRQYSATGIVPVNSIIHLDGTPILAERNQMLQKIRSLGPLGHLVKFIPQLRNSKNQGGNPIGHPVSCISKLENLKLQAPQSAQTLSLLVPIQQFIGPGLLGHSDTWSKCEKKMPNRLSITKIGQIYID